MKDIILKHVLINAVEHNGKADIQAVIGKVLAEDPSLKKNIKAAMAKIKETTEKINSLSPEDQNRMFENLGIKIEKKVKEYGLPELPEAKKGKVVMRMAPYPSGPLHIGNARMVILNDEYAKRYEGKLILVFDDTIGSEEKFVIPEAYDMIKDSIDWLGVKVDKVFYKSDRLEIFYKHAEELIRKDVAYVCLCDSENLRKLREQGNECSHRKHSVKENLDLWKKMLGGKFKEGEATVRLKTDMNHPDPAFRDRVMLRIADKEHPRVRRKYRVWPMLEFSWAIDDYLLGVTHVLRGKDLIIEDMVEEFIWGKLGWKKSQFVHYGMLNVEEAKLSKTEARKNIEKGVYSGWDDPRTWSLQSLKKRGMQPEAIRKFIINMGLSLADVNVPAEILYAGNRKIIDSVANRYFAVVDPVLIKVEDVPKFKEAELPLHPDFAERGKKKVSVDTEKIYVEKKDLQNFDGREIRLMDLFNMSISNGSCSFTSRELKTEIPKVQWVSEPNIKIKIVMPDGTTKNALAEPAMKELKVDAIIQLVRVGFCRVDKSGQETVLYFSHK